MRNRVVGLLSAVALCCAVALAAPAAGQRQAGPVATPAQGKFEPRDLAGIWARRGGDRSISAKAPPLTREGAAVLAKHVPARSRDSRAPSSNIPSDSNDPAFACNPKGFPRLLIDTANVWHEVIQLNGRLLQLWQEERRPREIWTDGRAVPSGEALDNLGPSWYGHSVGQWQGNTLVVQTVGLDDRAWVDVYGYPKSANARVEERYTRIDADTIEVRLTLFDPSFYAAPWVSDTKVFTREPRANVTFFGWYGLFSGLGELICAPMNASPVNKKGG